MHEEVGVTRMWTISPEKEFRSFNYRKRVLYKSQPRTEFAVFSFSVVRDIGCEPPCQTQPCMGAFGAQQLLNCE